MGTRSRRWGARLATLIGVAVYVLLRAPSSTEPAIANGDSRTLSFVNNHTNESASFTYRANGYYDEAVLEKLNWFMRDWRLNEQIKMDPRLFDILWEVYRQSSSSQPIDVLSAYRSPQTNAMLRRRSRQVAEHSQHMQGKAIDAHFIDVGPGAIRDVAMRMQEGGVGFYPIGSTPWVHVDSGTVRYWPRMSRSAMARLFPDGKTVFIPADGQPMERYAEAKAMVEARGGDVQVASSGGGLFGWLFGGARGGGADDEEETGGSRVIAGGRGGAFVSAGVGRGGPAPAIVAVAAPSAPVAPPPAAPPPATPPPPPPVAAEPAATAPDVAAADSEAPDAPAVLRASSGASVPAPTPPRRPASLLASIDPATPTPPRRPAEFAVATTEASSSPPSPAPLAPASARGDDLIAALIERNALPNAITKGVHGAPKNALALVDPKSSTGGDPAALARATALSPPPMPPLRTHVTPEGVTTAQKSPPLPPPRPSKTMRPSAANPFGSLVVDAFNAPAPSELTARALLELRLSSP